MKQCKVISYRYDSKLNRSIPDKVKLTDDTLDGLFNLAEIKQILKVASGWKPIDK